jgi:hypothetical protein
MTTVACASMRRARARQALRLALAGGAVNVALLVLGGRAHAVTTPPESQPPAGAPASNTDGPAPPGVTTSSAAANTGTAAPRQDAASGPSDPSRTISASATLPAATGKAPSAASGTASGASGTPTPVKRDDNQSSGVTNTGVATAVSGANTAVGSTSQTPPAGAPPAAGPANGSGAVGTGNANAQGVDSQTSINQQVSAQANGQGRIHVLQIGLIIDVGVAEANSGHNYVRAALSPLEGTGQATVGTGNVNVVGLRGSTGITQSAKITNGQTAGQQAFVVNIGIAFGDSGSNVALVGATVSRNGQTAVAAGKVLTGGAHAIGDHSSSAIGQTATLIANDHGVLNVDQRAVIVNLGIALANSGFNTSSVGSLSAQEASVVQSILDALFGGAGFPGLSGFTGSSAGGTAAISTGNVVAIGNDTTTGIAQSVNGAVSGHGKASATQQAYVTNLGIAVGNSGGNLASVLGLGTGTAGQLAATQASTSSFLDQILHPGWLVGQGSQPQLSSAMDLAGGLLQVRGDVSGTMQLLGIPGTDGSEGTQVTVEQVSGVLHLSFAFADSGHNTATVGGDQAAGAGSGGLLAAIGADVAGIQTGNVNAVGGDFTVDVCQSIGDHACDEKPRPVKPPVEGVTLPPVVLARVELPAAPVQAPRAVPTQVEAASLPFTGAGSVPEEVLAAIAAIGIGVAAQLRRRRGARPVGS